MGLHWAWPSFQSLVPEAIFDRIQTTQVDPSMPVKSIERLPLLNGATGELLTATPVDRFYRLRSSKIRALLMEGLDVQTGKDLAGIAYSSDGRSVTASFEDGTSRDRLPPKRHRWASLHCAPAPGRCRQG